MRFGRPRLGAITSQIGSRTCRILNRKLTRTRNSLKSQFLNMNYHFLLSLSLWTSTLPSPKNKKLSHLSLYLHVMIMSSDRVQHTPSTAYTEYCIQEVLHHPKIDSLPLPASHSPLISWRTLMYSILYIPTITSLPVNSDLTRDVPLS
jgi:hypothetical protein